MRHEDRRERKKRIRALIEKRLNRPKNRWPRFSLSTWLVFIALICMYLSMWELTSRVGVPAFARRMRRAYTQYERPFSPAPFIIGADSRPPGVTAQSQRVYFFWSGQRFRPL